MKIFTLFFTWVLMKSAIRRMARANWKAKYRRDYDQRPDQKVKNAARKKQHYGIHKSEYIGRVKQWVLKNPEKRRKNARDWFNKMWRSSPEFRLASNFRTRLSKALRGAKLGQTTLCLLGCSIAELRAHLETQFSTGMSWDNYGEWHVDHVRPCVSFALVDPDQQKICFHYTNLQPLWAVDNLSKGAKCGD